MRKLEEKTVRFIVMCLGMFSPGFLPTVCGAVPVNISGDVYIDSGADVFISGLVLVDTVPAGNARLINSGSLTLEDSLMLASRNQKFGLFRNSGTFRFTDDSPGRLSVLRYFPTGDDAKFHALSFPFPVSIADIRGFDAARTFDTDYYLALYDGVRRATQGYAESGSNWRWLGQRTDDIPLSEHPDLKTGEACLIWTESPMALVFPASSPGATPDFFNSQPRFLDVSVHTGPTRPVNFGWNFIGNLQTDSFTLRKSSTGYRGFAYIHEGEGTFRTIDLAGNDEWIQIPFSGNAFVMQAYSFPDKQDGTLRINFFGNTSQSNESLMRSAAGLSPARLLELTLSSDQSPYSDRIRVLQNEQYSDGFVPGEDAPKMFSIPSSSGKPEFYTVLGENRLAFDSRQQTAEDIPLGIDLKGEAAYTVSVSRKEGYDGENVLLVDRSSGTETLHNLSMDPYVFRSGSVKSESLFALRFVQAATGMEKERKDSPMVVYAISRKLFVRNITQGANVWVYDVTGRLFNAGQSGEQGFECALPQEGIYMVRTAEDEKVVAIRN